MTLTVIGFAALGLSAVLLLAADTPDAKPKSEDKSATPKKPAHPANRLAKETSPYLLQHAHNPVDWYPWGAEALEKAKKEDKPIFLSVGYSTCHWCHVMAHESFEDEAVAKILNEYFICIKVDREERPDIDAQYMLATQLLTRRGGWPNSVWLTPDGRPWMAGTYFPKEDQLGRPGFKSILRQLADIWKTRREEVEKQADNVAEAIKQYGSGAHIESKRPIDRQIISRAVQVLESSFDEQHAGFGAPPNYAPKFPPHGALALIADQAKRLQYDLNAEAKLKPLMKLFIPTLDAMRLGGIHDHVGGGFHRYATDRRWFLPHFEKMLYDNAQLMHAYVDAYRLTGDERYRRTIEDIFTWISREMTDAKGGFYSALDADSEGEEGKFYVWTTAEIRKVLNEEDAKLFLDVYGFLDEGNFREEATGHRTGGNIPFLAKNIADTAAERKFKPDELREKLRALRAKLLTVRDQRIRPHLDDKIVTGWNGLMISALAYAGQHLKEQRYIEAAKRAASFILRNMRTDGHLFRTYRAGQARVDAYLDDYAFLSRGLLALHAATQDKQWLTEAEALVKTMNEQFADDASGAYFFSGKRHQQLLLRTEDPTSGGNTPSGNGVAAQSLLILFEHTKNHAYADRAQAVLNAHSGYLWQLPHATEDMIVALAHYYELVDRQLLTPKPAVVEKTDADAAARTEPVRYEAYLSASSAAPGQTVHVAIRLTTDDNWHIYANKQPKDSIVLPTELSIADHDAVKAGAAVYPAGKEVKDPAGDYFAYHEPALLHVPLTIDANAKPGQTTFHLIVKSQACNDETKVCLMPHTQKLELKLNIDPAAKSDDIRHRELFQSLGLLKNAQP